MFIDYLAIMLLNMTAGLFLLGAYMAWGMSCEDRRPWSAPFAAVGLVALLMGLHMTFTWPLPGPFNTAFGEMTILFGVAFLAAALAVGKGWSLLGVAVYGAIAGLGAIVVGLRTVSLGLTQMPRLTAAGYILVGAASLLVLAAVAMRSSRGLRIVAAVVLFISAGLWGFNAYGAYWMHLQVQQGWKPATMHAAPPPSASAPATQAAK